MSANVQFTLAASFCHDEFLRMSEKFTQLPEFVVFHSTEGEGVALDFQKELLQRFFGTPKKVEIVWIGN